jgi:hypothetical protein
MDSIAQFRVTPASYSPDRLLGGGVTTSGFEAHLLRNPPSERPGVDVARPYALGGDRLSQIVRSPVDGMVTAIKPQPWGRVSIRDANGYTFNFIHMQLGDPVSPGTLKVGDSIKAGTALGFVGDVVPPNVKPVPPHVHHYIESEIGTFIDPAAAFYDPTTGAVVADGTSAPLQPYWWAPQIREAETAVDSAMASFDRLLDSISEELHRSEVNFIINYGGGLDLSPTPLDPPFW